MKPLLRMTVPRGQGYRIVGPATIYVASGTATILGAEFSEGSRIKVPGHRSYFVAGIDHAELEIELEGNARIEKPVEGEEPLFNWIQTMDGVLEECSLPCKIAFVGPVDSGKTSLSLLTSNRSLIHGFKPAIVDLDIGQADIGPPAFTSIAFPDSWLVWMRDLEPSKSVFIGNIEPAYAEGRLVYAAVKLTNYAVSVGADVIVVDTDGWVTGWRALEHKLDLLRAVGADYTVVVGSRDLSLFLEARWPGKVVYLESPRMLYSRSPELRRKLRQEMYRRHLETGEERSFPLDTVKLVNACISSAFYSPLDESIGRIEGRRVLLAGQYPGGVCVLVDMDEMPDPGFSKRLAEELGVHEVLVITRGGLRDVLVGLVDSEGWDHPGLLVDLDLERREIRVRTKFQGAVKAVWVSRIKLSSSYTDLPSRRIWV